MSPLVVTLIDGLKTDTPRVSVCVSVWMGPLKTFSVRSTEYSVIRISGNVVGRWQGLRESCSTNR